MECYMALKYGYHELLALEWFFNARMKNIQSYYRKNKVNFGQVKRKQFLKFGKGGTTFYKFFAQYVELWARDRARGYFEQIACFDTTPRKGAGGRLSSWWSESVACERIEETIWVPRPLFRRLDQCSSWLLLCAIDIGNSEVLNHCTRSYLVEIDWVAELKL